MVSVVCNTYNHEKYIRDSVDGFLIQKTDFPIEIIIHDDASTDQTAVILQEYANKNPTKISLILQKKNQQSQGENTQMIPIRVAKGQYIALCDGDDYWTDPYKLQKQIDAMRQNPQCNLSFHPATCHNLYTQQSTILAQHADQIKIFQTDEVIVRGGGFMPTSSCIFKKEIFDHLPDWFYKTPVGDYFLQILGSILGGALYINEVMSVYRLYAQGSWTESNQGHNQQLELNTKLINSIADADRYTAHQYQHAFHQAQCSKLIEILSNRHIPLSKRKEIYAQYKQIQLPMRNRFMWAIIYQNSILHVSRDKLKQKHIKKRS